MSREMPYKYPTSAEISADVSNETTAINVAIAAMADSIEDSPLKDHMKVYACIELALKYGEAEYVSDVLNEVLLFRAGK